MLEAFQSQIQALLTSESTYLLACSGGMDSICLATLLHRTGISFEIAHVNFQLRGAASDEDSEFVRNWAERHQVPFHLKLAETRTLAEHKGISIQMAAREIRYAFFEELRAHRDLAGILLAHHQDDQLETIFLNLLRGTGIEGIYGMAEQKGWLIRPLLPFSRADIHDFMAKNSLPWREDQSNSKTDYKRNKLRIKGLPAIYGLEPDARKNLLTSFERLKDTGKAFQSLFENWKNQYIQEEEGCQKLDFSTLQRHSGASSLLYFWLRPYGFNSDQTQSIAETLDRPKPGTTFKGQGYTLHFDRSELFLVPEQPSFKSLELEIGDAKFSLPEAEYQIVCLATPIELDRNPLHAQLDASRLSFPLEIRTWQEGDRFVPLGMSRSKKISDFLIDIKLPLAKKQSVKVLVSGEEIAWVIGYRIADWAKCTPATQRILHFKKR